MPGGTIGAAGQCLILNFSFWPKSDFQTETPPASPQPVDGPAPKYFSNAPPCGAGSIIRQRLNREKPGLGNFQRGPENFLPEAAQDETGHMVAGKLRVVEIDRVQRGLFLGDDLSEGIKGAPSERGSSMMGGQEQVLAQARAAAPMSRARRRWPMCILFIMRRIQALTVSVKTNGNVSV